MDVAANNRLMQGILAALQRPVSDQWSDNYLRLILAREAVGVGLASPAHAVQAALSPLLKLWAGDDLSYLAFSGSCAKGTANKSSTDVDLLISLRPSCRVPLRVACLRLMNFLKENGYPAKLQNVSVGTSVLGSSVDLVPGHQQDDFSGDHSIFHRKSESWRKTNISTHVRHVIASGRRDVIRLTKLWRDQRRLEMPSFYLELAVIKALENRWYGSLSESFLLTLDYLAGDFIDDRFMDPANTNNVISDDLTRVEKLRIRAVSLASLKSNWTSVLH